MAKSPHRSGNTAVEATERISAATPTQGEQETYQVEAPIMSYTTPEEIVIHPIISQDIDKLLDETDNPAFSWALGLFFTGIGLLPSLGSALKGFFNKDMSLLDFFLGLLCIGLLASGIAKWTEARANKRTIAELRDRLRSRRKTKVLAINAQSSS